MVAKRLRAVAVLVLVVGSGNTSHAQRRIGGGGIGPGSTAPGDILRGEGIYLNGLGNYELNSARGRSIDNDTAIKWNQYVYESIKEHNRLAIEHLAREKERKLEAYRDIRKRIRDNPTVVDLRQGDALNVVLEELSNPKISPSSFRSARVSLDGGTIQNIPFQYPRLNGVISMRTLAVRDGWPLPMRSETFARERKAYTKAVETVLEQDLEGKLMPESVKAVQATVEALKAKVDELIPKTDRNFYLESRNFVKALDDASRLLEFPIVGDVLGGMEKYSGTTVAELLEFMRRYNLRFSPANPNSPTEMELYTKLYPLMRAQREQLNFKDE